MAETAPTNPVDSPNLITEVPEHLRVTDETRKDVAQVAGKLIEVSDVPTEDTVPVAQGAPATQPELIVGPAPGMERTPVRTPDDAVAEINAQLASRDPSAGQPEIRAGGASGVITQRQGAPMEVPKQ